MFRAGCSARAPRALRGWGVGGLLPTGAVCLGIRGLASWGSAHEAVDLDRTPVCSSENTVIFVNIMCSFGAFWARLGE